MWRIARDSVALDLNPPYAYLLWCRDFAETSLVATVEDRPAGFVIGYRRPQSPATLMVWQIAVDQEHRGAGIASHLLDRLVDGQERSVTWLESTVSADNEDSIRLFSRFAAARGVELVSEPLFDRGVFPDQHDPEVLRRIGPLG
jgi:diaminobutyrate acetyltransferase